MAEKPGHSQQFSFFSASHNNPIGKINATGRGELGLNLQLSSDYNLLPEFELLVGANIRATLFELISPKARLQIPAGSIVNFTWENGDNSMPVTISILNNRGNCIFETDTLHENCYLLDTDYFQKGLFYWRITRDNDLITLGKMTLF